MADNDPAGEAKTDTVNNTSHDSTSGVDSFMYMRDQIGKDAFDGFLQGNVMKHVQGYRFNGRPVEDLCSAAFYLFHLIFEAEPDRAKRDAALVRLGEILAQAMQHFGLYLPDGGVK